jgi:hypothetical protein
MPSAIGLLQIVDFFVACIAIFASLREGFFR